MDAKNTRYAYPASKPRTIGSKVSCRMYSLTHTEARSQSQGPWRQSVDVDYMLCVLLASNSLSVLADFIRETPVLSDSHFSSMVNLEPSQSLYCKAECLQVGGVCVDAGDASLVVLHMYAYTRTEDTPLTFAFLCYP